MTGVMFILRKHFGKAGLVTLCVCVRVCACVRAHACIVMGTVRERILNKTTLFPGIHHKIN